MSATFIISWDCEGKWGMADHLVGHHEQVLTNKAIRRVYQEIVSLQDELKIAATFAFVGAFTLNRAEYEEFSPFLGNSPHADKWLRRFREEATRGSLEGWMVPEALETVMASGRHEIASHGFTHLPLDTASCEDAEREIGAAVRLARARGLDLATFVFPRNAVNHTEILARHGFIAHRSSRAARSGIPGRVRRLAEEFNIFAGSEIGQVGPDQYMSLPAGHFLNWRRGMRSLVPAGITIQRWRNILDHAIRTRGVAHCWSHPHNLLDGRAQLGLLERVLREVQSRVALGDLVVHTQESYARSIMQRARAELGSPRAVI